MMAMTTRSSIRVKAGRLRQIRMAMSFDIGLSCAYRRVASCYDRVKEDYVIPRDLTGYKTGVNWYDHGEPRPVRERFTGPPHFRGWSQEQLARRSGLSRAGISAIETDRLIPSAAAALALAAALECRVEDLFRLRGSESHESSWAWSPRREPCRYWKAEVGGG